jgi:uncharacterized protein YjbJ (UPF0337 family)
MAVINIEQTPVGARAKLKTWTRSQFVMLNLLAPRSSGLDRRGREIMDKDRVVGSAKQLKGAVKQAVGKAVGDAKLESEGKADKIEGKIQNAVGGLKDTLSGR